jgi:hypothetical protein
MGTKLVGSIAPLLFPISSYIPLLLLAMLCTLQLAVRALISDAYSRIGDGTPRRSEQIFDCSCRMFPSRRRSGDCPSCVGFVCFRRHRSLLILSFSLPPLLLLFILPSSHPLANTFLTHFLSHTFSFAHAHSLILSHVHVHVGAHACARYKSWRPSIWLASDQRHTTIRCGGLVVLTLREYSCRGILVLGGLGLANAAVAPTRDRPQAQVQGKSCLVAHLSSWNGTTRILSMSCTFETTDFEGHHSPSLFTA